MHAQVNRCVYWKTLRKSLFNITVINFLYSACTYPLVVWRGMPRGYEGLPTFPSLIWQLLVCMVVDEVGLYYVHR